MEDYTKELRDYIVTIKRKRISIAVITSVLFLICILFAALLPPTYKSEATILIEQQDIPTDLVRSTVTSYAAERIQVIQARAMSRTNLLKIIEKFDLYAKERKKETTDEIITQMREDAVLDVISANVVDPSTGRSGVSTIAFSLSYESRSAKAAQQVASELTSLYLNENLKSRTEKAEETTAFLKEESRRLGIVISDLENKLAEFKQANARSLPELQSANLQFMHRYEAELAALVANSQTVQEKMFYIEAQMKMLEKQGVGGQDSATRLRLMEEAYSSASARYSSDHPDIIRMEKEIEVLRNDKAGTTNNSGSVENSELLSLKAELKRLKEQYTDEHPDVVSLNRKIDALGNVTADEIKQESEETLSNDPVYVTLKTQMISMERELQTADDLKKSLKAKIDELERSIFNSPQIEREYLSLTRDYQNALVKYQETKSKEMQSVVSKQLEAENKGERFTLIDPPLLPEEPISPNRPAIIVLGFIMSIGTAIGYVLLSGIMLGFVQGAKHVEAILGVAALSRIPLQFNDRDLQKRKSLKISLVIGAIAVLIVVALIVHFLFIPLDVLWFRSIRKVDIIVG